MNKVLSNNIEKCGFLIKKRTYKNCVFGDVSKVWIVEDRNGQKLVAKEHPRWISRNDLKWINKYLTKLKQENIPVALPLSRYIKTSKGYFAVYQYIQGKSCNIKNNKQIIATGYLLSKIHVLSSQMKIIGQRNWQCVANTKYLKKYNELKEMLMNNSKESVLMKKYLEKSLGAFNIGQKMISNIENKQVFPIHGDFHYENIKFLNNVVSGVFDFDNSRNDYPEADLAAMVNFLLRNNFSGYQKYVNYFFKGYFRLKNHIKIIPEYILGSVLILSAEETLYLIKEYNNFRLKTLYLDLVNELKLISFVVDKQSKLLNFFQDAIVPK